MEEFALICILFVCIVALVRIYAVDGITRGIHNYLRNESCLNCGGGIKWEWGHCSVSGGVGDADFAMRGMCRSCDHAYEARITVSVSPRSGDLWKR